MEAASGAPGQVGLLVGVVAVLHLSWFAGLPEVEQVQRVSDDAFYYLVLARNFAESGRWTFDHVATASGFHPLHAFFLAGVAALSSSFQATVWTAGFAAAAALAAAAWLCGRIVDEVVGGFAVFWVAVCLTTPLVLLEVTSLMESPWVILAAALACRGAVASSRWSLATLASIGALGSLARTDFGMLPAVMGVAALLVPMAPPERRRLLRRVGALLVGAAAALALFSLYVHDYSGHWLQSSVRVKSRWAAEAAPDLASYGQLVALLVLTPQALVFVVGAVAQLAAAGVARLRKRRGAPGDSGGSPAPAAASREAAWLAWSGAATVLAYVVFYGTRNSATPQTWYAAGMTVPLALSVAIAAGRLLARARPGRAGRVACATLVAVAIAASLPGVRFARFPHQANLLAAARWLAGNPPPAPVGAFNAGVLSYFSRADVVNLDGLVNDEVVDYVLRGDLEAYLDARGVGYVLDYPGMWQDAALRRRGGYADGGLVRRLRLEHSLEPLLPGARWHRGHPVLMRLEPGTR